MIGMGCTSIDELLEAYIKMNGLDLGPLKDEGDMIKLIFVSGASGAIAILANRIAEGHRQCESGSEMKNISDCLAKITTELLIKVEQYSGGPVGTA